MLKRLKAKSIKAPGIITQSRLILPPGFDPGFLLVTLEECPGNNTNCLVSLPHGDGFHLGNSRFFERTMYSLQVGLFGNQGGEPETGTGEKLTLADHIPYES